MEAYLQCRKHKRKTYNALAFEENWMQNCVTLHKELSDDTYKIGKSIAFAVTRPKLREVFAADFRDRIVHHLIIGRLEPLFEEYFINDCYNCRKGKGTLYGFNQLHKYIKECSEDYTKDCWILKGDMKGFFMSIHKPTLWKMLEAFINERYKGKGKKQLLWLTKIVALHSPERDCTIKGDRKLLESLPADKSLFTCGEDYGLPIGNLTSQMFANFYLSGFDHWMKDKFKYYGRYVDDFYIICRDKKALLDILPKARKYLSELNVTLHPRKLYLQHYTKGVSFIGATSKMSRRYIGNRTVHNMMEAIREMNSIVGKKGYAESFTSRVNSYLGFMKHHNSYALRRKAMGELDKEWWQYCYIQGHHEKVVLKKKYKNKIINELKL